MNDAEIKGNLFMALEKYVANDHNQLFTTKVHEMAISHRIAVYLGEIFEKEGGKLRVDCEYDKKGQSGNKKLSNKRPVRPDIVVHQRFENRNNLLLVEVKKCGFKSAKGRNEMEKLKGYRGLQYGLRVYLGVMKSRMDMVLFTCDGNCEKLRYLIRTRAWICYNSS